MSEPTDFEIDISNQQAVLPIDVRTIRKAMLHALQVEEVRSAILSISIVDDATIHVMNRDYLQHDCPTDVISFQLDFSSGADPEVTDREDRGEVNEDEDHGSDAHSSQDTDGDPVDSLPNQRCDLRARDAAIEGEIVASAEMAVRMAADGNWSGHDELLLYIIHGLLHICGYDDLSADEKKLMRSRERSVLAGLGLQPVYPDDESIPTAPAVSHEPENVGD